MESFDYVIVGGGPGGCVLANRLSADPAIRVILLECGPDDRHPLLHMPKGIGKILGHAGYTWAFDIHRQKGANAPSSIWVRGRTLGGSSSVNGLMYVRGQPADYEALAAETSDDWNWAQMGKAFKAIEHHSLPPSETRGDKGPLHVTTYPRDGGAEQLVDAVIKSAESLGVPYEEDVNTPNNSEKIGYGVRTIYKGRRQSAAVAFLRPIRRRRNLTVKTNALVSRVLFDRDRAVGVECQVDGAVRRIEGAKIILCGGTISSPAILQRSGVGPADLLASLGIPVVADRPQVGENLREHSAISMQWRAKNTPSNNPRYRGLGLFWSGLQYYLTRSGPLSNATFEVTGFFKSNAQVDRANAQLLFAPHSLDYSKMDMGVERQPGFVIAGYPLRPRSKGQVRIQSKDPTAAPKVVMDFFADEDDRREQVEFVRYIRKLAATPPLSNYAAEETRPGPDCQSEEQILDAFHRLGTPGYHAAGTCRMGSDPDSVVDPKTRVRGVRNLHVVDLSIAPFVIAGNTYGPVAAMAWRAADLILDQH